MKPVLFVVVLVTLVGGGVWFVMSQAEDTNTNSDVTTNTQQPTNASANKEAGTATNTSTEIDNPNPPILQNAEPQTNTNTSDSVSTTPGKYIDYSSNVIAQTSGTKLLFFHAPWCPQCRQLESSIENGKIPDGVTIIKVDYDSMQDLKKQYGVTLQTTVVRVDDNGDLVKKYNAYSNPSLDTVVKELL